MVIDAAFEVARTQGAENINARTVSGKLGCSTQPVMYHFETIEDLKRAAYQKTDHFHTEFLMNIGPEEDVMLAIGLNYLRFAKEEPHLFRFLFQSGFAIENSLLEIIDSEELLPILSAMKEAMSMDMAKTKEVFLILAMFVHGYASLMVNNGLAYDEKTVIPHLESVFRGAVFSAQTEHAVQSERALQEDVK